ncbi:hypothetical protein Cgig2_002904 [Carnegiea gigantea]|uniref:Reverse transcriptase zinc-binding domain-containing protein n=1 Tax=Carnegiea gigantea TaxID=171969 RepID=A0A9Q1GH15_9CARY|nr:hypothetical protein Cgig2_002904 [Carnegiea gigantea]
MESLSKIGSMLGIPIKTDKTTKEKAALSYARLLIEMPVSGPFSDCIDFIFDGDKVVRQFVKYEWKPTKCTHCLMFGHEEQNCTKKQRIYPWCVMGDFNSVLHPGERTGGDEIQSAEITYFSQCLKDCDLYEINTTGVFFTWTNKTVWSKIDRVLGLGYTHVQSLTKGLSDYALLKINFPSCLKRRQVFRFYEMWTFDPLFKNLVTQHWAKQPPNNKLHNLCITLKNFKRMNRRPGIVHEDSAFIPLPGEIVKQTTMSYVYTIRDEQGRVVEGFEEVAKVITTYYQKLLANREKSQTIVGGCNSIQRQSLLIGTGYEEGTLPFRYLRVPISANTLSKLENSMLVEKITKRIKGSTTSIRWQWDGGRDREYTIQQGYNWYAPNRERYRWTKLVWSNLNIPRHTFTAWVTMRHKLPCQQAEETHAHLFYHYVKAREVWAEMSNWLGLVTLPTVIENPENQKEDCLCYGHSSYTPAMVGSKLVHIFRRRT